MDNRAEAKKLMKHYFRLATKAAGLPWTFENDAEIEALVDCLIKAAQQSSPDPTAWGDYQAIKE